MALETPRESFSDSAPGARWEVQGKSNVHVQTVPKDIAASLGSRPGGQRGWRRSPFVTERHPFMTRTSHGFHFGGVEVFVFFCSLVGVRVNSGRHRRPFIVVGNLESLTTSLNGFPAPAQCRAGRMGKKGRSAWTMCSGSEWQVP